MQRQLLTVTSAALLLSACTAGVADVNEQEPGAEVEFKLEGSFAMTHYNGVELPAPMAPMPGDRVTQEPSECFIMMGNGALKFAPVPATARLTYRIFNSCTGNTMQTANLLGTYTHDEQSFTISLPRDPDDPLILTGTIEAARLTLRHETTVYTFARP